jgi:hypothetical protein
MQEEKPQKIEKTEEKIVITKANNGLQPSRQP